MELVDALEVRGLTEQQQVGVTSRTHQRESAQQALGGEVLAGGDDLALVGRSLLGIQAPPGGIDLQKRVFDELALGHALGPPA